MKKSSLAVLALALLGQASLPATLSAATVAGPPGGLTLTVLSNNLVLSFPTTGTNFYGLQTAPGLAQPWVNLQAGIRGNGTIEQVTLNQAITAGQGFYQVVIQPPPVQLYLPQSDAFAVLGYSCGGIQEQVFATGFGSTNGYPTGVVDLSTSCGGSGNGGGYHTTTHTAAVSVIWDFGGNVVAYSTLVALPPIIPNFLDTDAFGDILYDSGNNAYLIVPVPAEPVGVTAVQSGDQFLVSWISQGVNPAAITNSILTATPVNSTNPVLTATVTGPATNGVITTLQPSTTYLITVVNTTIGGSSPASAPLNVTTEVASVAPSAPTNVVASWSNPDPTGTNPLATNDTLVVAWSAAVPGDSPVDQYQVVIQPDDGTSPLTNFVSGTTLTTYFTVNFTPNWKTTVQAHNAVGWGPVSAAINLGGL